jgi:DNA-binding transcriptional regulator LsrR (DeoR family)
VARLHGTTTTDGSSGAPALRDLSAARGRAVAADFKFHFPITQTDLADMMGLSAVHANRTVQDLRRTGLIVWEGHDVTITDWAALAAIRDYDNTYLHLVQEPQ